MPEVITPATNPAKTRYTHAEWVAEATRLFGADPMKWRFVCPICKHVATVQDWKDAGASEGSVAFSCIGRFLPECADAFSLTGDTKSGPCNYTGGGLFRLNPVTVIKDGSEHQVFDFAPPEGVVLLNIDASAFPESAFDAQGCLKPGVGITAGGKPLTALVNQDVANETLGRTFGVTTEETKPCVISARSNWRFWISTP